MLSDPATQFVGALREDRKRLSIGIMDPADCFEVAKHTLPIWDDAKANFQRASCGGQYEPR